MYKQKIIYSVSGKVKGTPKTKVVKRHHLALFDIIIKESNEFKNRIVTTTALIHVELDFSFSRSKLTEALSFIKDGVDLTVQGYYEPGFIIDSTGNKIPEIILKAKKFDLASPTKDEDTK